MSSEVQINNSSFLNFQTRPKVNKCKILNSSVKNWNISSTGFCERSLGKEEAFISQKKFEFPSYVHSAYTPNKNINLLNTHCGEDFNSSECKSLSRITNSLNESSPNNTSSGFCPVPSKTSLFYQPKKEKKTFPRKNCNFNVQEIQASFSKEKYSSVSVSSSQVISAVEPSEVETVKKEKQGKLTLNHSFHLSNSFSLDIPSQHPHLSSTYFSEQKSKVPFICIDNSFKNKAEIPKVNISWDSTKLKLLSDQRKRLIAKLNSPFKAIENLTQNASIQCDKNNHQSTKLNKLTVSANFEKLPPEFHNLENISHLQIPQEMKKFKNQFFPLAKQIVQKRSFSVLANTKHFVEPQLDFIRLEDKSPDISQPLVKRKRIESETFRLPEELSVFAEFQTMKRENAENQKDSSSFQEIRCSSNLGHLGSSWVQSLQWENEEYEPCEKRKKLRNTLPGGYADQIMKLQRRELFDIVIWEHKSGTERTDAVTLNVKATLHMDEIVVTKCSFAEVVLSGEENDSKMALKSMFKDFYSSDLSSASETEVTQFLAKLDFFVLFQKTSFCKQQLKMGKSFLLLHPWHYLKLKSIQTPVIICKYFKNANVGVPSNDELQAECITGVETNVKQKNEEKTNISCSPHLTKNKNRNMFFEWNRKMNLIARIQRIWEHKSSTHNIPVNVLEHLKGLSRFSLLLQCDGGLFYELIISCCKDSPIMKWLQYAMREEGKCYSFSNLLIAHRYQQKKYSEFFYYLREITKQSTANEVSQDFIYQLVVDKISKIPAEVIGIGVPAHISVEFQPLSQLVKDFKENERFSCKASVFLQYNSVLYINDESVSLSASEPYAKIFLLDANSIIVGSKIIVKEALVHEGCLVLDQYSHLSVEPYHTKRNKSGTLNIQNLEIPLRDDSRTSDIVFVSGKIISVDESNSFTWLQCNFCMKENLVQDSNNIIYCEDCSYKVVQPTLNVKMNVIIASETTPQTVINMQLLSNSVKKILFIGEKSLQPQCSVSDVIGKTIGPLLCYVKGVEKVEHQKHVYLCEIEI